MQAREQDLAYDRVWATRTEGSVVGELGHLRDDEQEHEDREALQRRGSDVDLRVRHTKHTR
jgi:hypothetical protein